MNITQLLAILILLNSIFLPLSFLPLNAKKKTTATTTKPTKNSSKSSKKTDLSNFKIISAEKLDYSEGNSILIGNVKIKMGDFVIAAPKVLITSDKNGDSTNARFIENVILDSKDLKITAPEMQIDVQKALFKCFANDKQLVKSLVGDKGDVIYSGYQEYEIQTGFGRAATKDMNNPEAIQYIDQVKYQSKDLEVVSDTLEMDLANGKLQYVDFIGNAVAKDTKQRTQANEIFYFPTQSLLKADGTVKILYLKEEQPTYVFGDQVLYEREKKIFSAFSESLDPHAEAYGDNAYGKARQIILLLDEKDKLDRAILTGNAYAQYKDKSMLGHELLMNIKEKTLETLVGRPKTQVLKVASKEEPKVTKKKSKKSAKREKLKKIKSEKLEKLNEVKERRIDKEEVDQDSF